MSYNSQSNITNWHLPTKAYGNPFIIHQRYLLKEMYLNSLPNGKILDLSKVKALCRPQFKCVSKIEICFGKGRKHCGKRRKCWLPAFSPFPTMFSKGLFLRVVKSRDCVVKS